jgi:uncharacterized membrane-anchored protein YhcB (DUF1043 family)
MILLPLALDSITGDTGVSIQLAMSVGLAIGGAAIGAVTMRILQGEAQRRQADDIKELKEWKSTTTLQLQELQTERRVREEVQKAVQEAVQEERSSGSTTRGTRPKPRLERP